MNLFCIADEDTVRGFRLAGVAGAAVNSVEEAAAALDQAVAQAECGLVILTDMIAQGIRPKVDAIRLEQDRPLIVEIPGPRGPLPGRKSLRQLAQQAIGVGVSREEPA